MKIMMGVDLEGITGVTDREHTACDGRRYAEAIDLMAGDINATVDGLLEGGVDEVIVWDNHAVGLNALQTKLHGGAKYCRGHGSNGTRWPMLDDSVDGLILLGYHAKAGTYGAVLEHTMTSASWLRLTVNGREIGEIGIDGALAATVGVPVIMVSGDDKLCAEAADLFGERLVAVCVKQAYARHGALCLPPEQSAELLRDGAIEAVKRIGEVPPLDLGSPAVVQLAFKHTDHADAADLRLFDGQRIDGYTVQWTCPDLPAWMGFTAKNPPTRPTA